VGHVGRTSGRSYQTPLDALHIKSGYVLVCRYGPESDWVQNILAAGSATLRVDGQSVSLVSPRLVSLDEALEELTVDDPPKSFAKAEHFLLMDRVA
jgi:deazaflavin-dependent oxidoreductase (nitroreductase family)